MKQRQRCEQKAERTSLEKSEQQEMLIKKLAMMEQKCLVGTQVQEECKQSSKSELIREKRAKIE